MEAHTNNAENNEENPETNIEMVKDKLRKQIKELRSINMEMTCNLNIYCFKDVKVVTKPTDPEEINAYAHEVVNVQTIFESELYRYAGFYCTKFLENEYVFKFSPSNKYDIKNTFGMQILIKDGKGTLGKWVMPMSIDLDDLKIEFSIDDPKNLPHFLRMCKNYIDCYFIRCEQYNTLMDTVSNIKDCKLQTSFGYTDFILELRGVYCVEDESYVDIIIFLIYAIDETRPYKIEVDSTIGRPKLNKRLRRQLQSSLQVFQLLDLQAAFDCMFDKEPFIWSKLSNDDTILQTNNLSSEEEEGFLETLLSSEKTSSIRQKRKRKISRVMKKKSKKKTSDILKIFEHSAESISPQNKNKEAKKQSSVYKKRTETTKFTLTKNRMKQKTLKQTKLMLEKNNLELQQENNIPSAVDSERKSVAKLYGPSTSTPYRKNQESHFSSATDIDNISGITIIEKNPLDARTKHNKTENAPAKVINNEATKNVKPLGGKKSIQLKKKTSHKK
ncbi:uncharacterized protein LOC143182445 [Calliopsis andreniformis]|uniref:uncharacterized protein LOC143182445 n=1 Tax=Calliopsis andreniformis TaxID=337506 RepID=UPI003FCC2E04